MLKKTHVGLVLFVVAIFSLSGCKIPEHVKLRCTAEVAEAFADGVDSGVPVDVEVNATGGEVPYYMLGVIGTFNPSTTISRSYTNDGEEDIIIDDLVLVNDNLGFTTQCGFSVTVRPEPVDPDPNPTLVLVATPSASVDTDSIITVTATATDFGDTPSFVFDFDEVGVAIAQNENIAEFFATDDLGHQFDVTVTASGDGEEVSETITLNFTLIVDDPTLECTLTHDTGDYEIGDTVPFSVTAITGESLVITEGSTGTDGTVQYLVGNIFGISYSSIGTKVVTVKAESDAGIKCNNGETLSDVVTIESAQPVLSCNAFTDESNYRVWYGPNYPNWDGSMYNSVVTWAEIPAGVGVGTVSIVDVAASNDPEGHYFTYNNDPLAKEIFFYEAGFFQVTLTVEDTDGNRATCLTDFFNVWW